MKINFGNVALKFTNFKVQKDKDKFENMPNCDVKGKELKWNSGKTGYYTYVDSGEKFSGKRTEVYKYDTMKEKVLEKTQRTTHIDLDSEVKKMVKSEMEQRFVPVSEKYCLNDNGVFDFLDEKECIVFTIQLTESYGKNLKIGAIYKQNDIIIMRINAPIDKLQQIQQAKEGMVDNSKLEKLENKNKKVIKKVGLDELGI